MRGAEHQEGFRLQRSEGLREAGTAPEDRTFRPDVQGLRAVAVLLVVLFHYSFPGLSGGFVGVDVFFVISGFVITGLLLREQKASGRTSLLAFYARRARRILPAAAFVVLVTVLVTFIVLPTFGRDGANDGRWALTFLANFHWMSLRVNHWSAFTNYWSLAVEEQFYLVFPVLFLLVARFDQLLSLRTRLVIALSTIIVGSYWLSIVQTHASELVAYQSPLTRSWELALGALVCVCTSWLKELPPKLASWLTWAGVGAIVFAAVDFHTTAGYPGSKVAIPVIGSAAVIAGGVSNPGFGAEMILGTRPFRWVGERSYSMYLWFWPLLIRASQLGHNAGTWDNRVLLMAILLALTVITHRVVESPVRRLTLSPRNSVAGGVALVAGSVGLLTLFL